MDIALSVAGTCYKLINIVLNDATNRNGIEGLVERCKHLLVAAGLDRNETTEVSKDNIFTQVKSIVNLARPNDSLVFTFSGHGDGLSPNDNRETRSIKDLSQWEAFGLSVTETECGATAPRGMKSEYLSDLGQPGFNNIGLNDIGGADMRDKFVCYQITSKRKANAETLDESFSHSPNSEQKDIKEDPLKILAIALGEALSIKAFPPSIYVLLEQRNEGMEGLVFDRYPMRQSYFSTSALTLPSLIPFSSCSSSPIAPTWENFSFSTLPINYPANLAETTFSGHCIIPGMDERHVASIKRNETFLGGRHQRRGPGRQSTVRYNPMLFRKDAKESKEFPDLGANDHEETYRHAKASAYQLLRNGLSNVPDAYKIGDRNSVQSNTRRGCAMQKTHDCTTTNNVIANGEHSSDLNYLMNVLGRMSKEYQLLPSSKKKKSELEAVLEASYAIGKLNKQIAILRGMKSTAEGRYV